MTQPRKVEEQELKIVEQITKVLERFAIATNSTGKCYPESFVQEIIALIRQADRKSLEGR